MADFSKHKILLVDDEERITKSLKRLLTPLGLRVIIANSGAEGLEILKKDQISLIISDQKMPIMTGTEFLEKSMSVSPDSLRILLTGYADIDATINAINSGAVRYYLNKPWEENVLISRIQESLENYEMKIENTRLQKLTREQNEKLVDLNENLEQKVDEQTREIRNKNKELSKSFMDSIKAFSTIVGLRNEETGSHSQRVTALVKAVINKMELSEIDYQDIVIAAFLHDIGKISFSDNLLAKKNDEYTSQDRERIKKHPILGQSCIYFIGGFENIGQIIRHHHEDYDGTGYPDGLDGTNIPLGSRIIRIADAFDKFTFKNGYPKLETIKEATGYLVQHSSSKFDPVIVRQFEINNIGLQFLQKENQDANVLSPFNLSEGMTVAADIYTKSGMFLLPKGAKLSERMISRLIKIHHSDPIKEGVAVYFANKKTERKHAKV